jgi:hypothetical protein
MKTGNFGNGFNAIKIIICNHLQHLSRRSAVPERAKSRWVRFAGIISRVQGGPHDRCETAPALAAPALKNSACLSAGLSREQRRAKNGLFLQGSSAQSKWALFAGISAGADPAGIAGRIRGADPPQGRRPPPDLPQV